MFNWEELNPQFFLQQIAGNSTIPNSILASFFWTSSTVIHHIGQLGNIQNIDEIACGRGKQYK